MRLHCGIVDAIDNLRLHPIYQNPLSHMWYIKWIVNYRLITPIRRDQPKNKLIVYQSVYRHHKNGLLYLVMVGARSLTMPKRR